MPGGLTKRQIKGITKKLGHDYLAEKERKKQRRREKAAQKKDRSKGERHRSRQQEIEDIVIDELEMEGGSDE